MGVVERGEGGECCLAPRHTFQSEENKSIRKSPQEQNVPLLQECVLCASVCV